MKASKVIAVGLGLTLWWAAGTAAAEPRANKTDRLAPPAAGAPTDSTNVAPASVEGAIGGQLTQPAVPGVSVKKAPPLEPPSPLPDETARFGGLIGQAAQMESPLQLLNPFAPPEYGDGTQNLSIHPTTGRAEGVILFSINLRPKPKPQAPRHGLGSGRVTR